MTTIYVFPGQGSQSLGMGRELLRKYPHLVRMADEVLGYSIEQLCLRGPAKRLNDTRYTQPALYTVNALFYLERVRETGRVPAFVAGHSLGEYSALFAAGAFDFLTGLELVAERGRLMSLATEGGMAAVLAISPEHIADLLATHGCGDIDVANYNAPAQTVLSGRHTDLQAVRPLLEQAGARFVPLRVSAAFHSRCMREAEMEFGRFVSNYRLACPKIPVIANVSALPYEDDVAQPLVEQMTSPVQWVKSITYLMAQPEATFHEVGPGRVLSGLIRQIEQAAPSAAA